MRIPRWLSLLSALWIAVFWIALVAVPLVALARVANRENIQFFDPVLVGIALSTLRQAVTSTLISSLLGLALGLRAGTHFARHQAGAARVLR